MLLLGYLAKDTSSVFPFFEKNGIERLSAKCQANGLDFIEVESKLQTGKLCFGHYREVHPEVQNNALRSVLGDSPEVRAVIEQMQSHQAQVKQHFMDDVAFWMDFTKAFLEEQMVLAFYRCYEETFSFRAKNCIEPKSEIILLNNLCADHLLRLEKDHILIVRRDE